MSWLFSGKKPDPTPPKNDARRPSGVVPTPAPAASTVNLNAKGRQSPTLDPEELLMGLL
jgi:hypothetical protein